MSATRNWPFRIRVLLLVNCLLLNLSSCAPPVSRQLSDPGQLSEKGIVFYNLVFEIAPQQGIFRSQQQIALTGNLAQGRKLSIFIGETLVVDSLTLKDNTGETLTIAKWQKVGRYAPDYWWGHSVFSEIEIQTTEAIPTAGQLTVNLAYHLPAESLQQGLAPNLYSLFVSPQSIQAGGPESGAFPLVSGNLSAPFKLTIRHPDTLSCALPGERVSSEKAEGYVTVTYQADTAYDPSFACAPYTVLSTKADGLEVELFMPAQLNPSPEMLTAADTLAWYQANFGEPPARSFRIVFPNVDDQEGGGESNGNLILLANAKPFLHYTEDAEARDTFAHLIAHEGYHLWNTWGLNWEGPLAEWWTEGGANFMASWAKEALYGDEAGARNRQRDVEAYGKQEAYRHKNSLAHLDESWVDDWALVYDYGALVWEQLRQAAGTEALAAGLRDFYQTYRHQTTNSRDFLACLEKHTSADVAAILDQWTQHNAQVNLAIRAVNLQPAAGGWEAEVDIEIEADRNYEIFTALGYKLPGEEGWRLVNLHLTGNDRYHAKFQSEGRPVQIQIDPEYRVPQINPDDNPWTDTGPG